MGDRDGVDGRLTIGRAGRPNPDAPFRTGVVDAMQHGKNAA